MSRDALQQQVEIAVALGEVEVLAVDIRSGAAS